LIISWAIDKLVSFLIVRINKLGIPFTSLEYISACSTCANEVCNVPEAEVNLWFLNVGYGESCRSDFIAQGGSPLRTFLSTIRSGCCGATVKSFNDPM